MKSVRKRRLERRTDYKARFGLLKSGKIRLVVRKTNRYMIAQIVETKIAQDKVLAGVSSKILLAKGWPKEKAGSLKSIAASYLTGIILGKLAKKKKINDVILDIGMIRNVYRTRIYSVLKGAIDAGMKIRHENDALPLEKDLRRNERVAYLIDEIKEKV